MQREPYIDWSKVSDLGKVPDKEIAKRYSVGVDCVERHRRKMGISYRKPPINWSSVRGLGVETDAVIAEKVGCRVPSVCRARKRLGIQSKRYKRKPDWSVVTFGEKTDAATAKEYGLTELSIRQKRLRLGITSLRQKRKQRCEEIPVHELMAKGGLSKLAKKYGCSECAISSRRVRLDPSRSDLVKTIPKEIKDKLRRELNSTWDLALSKKYNVSPSTMTHIRREAGVTAYYAETRVCLCGNRFIAQTRRNIFCSKDCGHTHSQLRRSLNVEKDEVLNPDLFKMALQIYKRLVRKYLKIKRGKKE